jgi:hypothetical protein
MLKNFRACGHSHADNNASYVTILIVAIILSIAKGGFVVCQLMSVEMLD